MTVPPRITEAAPLEGRWVRLHFTDGLVQDVNLAPVFERGGVFAAIRDDRSVFEQVRVILNRAPSNGPARSTSIPMSSTAATNQPATGRSSVASSRPHAKSVLSGCRAGPDLQQGPRATAERSPLDPEALLEALPFAGILRFRGSVSRAGL